MAINDKITDEKLQYDISREAAKISALSSSKTDKYENLTGEEILPSDETRIIERDKFTYYLLGKAVEDQGIKQVEALKALKPEENKEDIKSIEGLFPKEMRSPEINNEIDEIKR